MTEPRDREARKDFAQHARDLVRAVTGQDEDDLDLTVPSVRDVPNRYGRSPEELAETRERIADARRRAETGQIRDDFVGGHLRAEEEKRRLASQ